MKSSNLAVHNPTATTNPANSLLCAPAPTDLQQNPLPSIQQQSQRLGTSSHPPERIRHILIGSPGSVRQTIHLLHTLGYSETLLWSPIATVESTVVITPAQGETMSLLIRQI